MDLNQATTDYGREFIHELIDIALITDFNVLPSYWRDLAIRYKLCTRRTQIVRSWSGRNETYWYYGKLNGERKYGRWETPQIQYKFILKNGSGKYLLNIHFTQPQMEEWLNETNLHQTQFEPSEQQ